MKAEPWLLALFLTVFLASPTLQSAGTDQPFANPPGYYLLGRQEMALKRYRQAIKQFSRSIRREAYPFSWRERASCYGFLGQNDNALDDYKAYLDKVPNDARIQAYAQRLEQKMRQQDFDRGLAWRGALYGAWQTLDLADYNLALGTLGAPSASVRSGWSGGLRLQWGVLGRVLIGPELEYMMSGAEVGKGESPLLGANVKAHYSLNNIFVSLPITYIFTPRDPTWRVGLGAAPVFVNGNGKMEYTIYNGSQETGISQQITGFQGLGYKVFASADWLYVATKASLGLELGWRSVKAGEVKTNAINDPIFVQKADGSLVRRVDGKAVPIDLSGIYACLTLAIW